ncbi:MAG: glycosyltransferase family 2 protein, partial [Novosphingobium sp.]
MSSAEPLRSRATIAVVIPCFRVGLRACDVIARIGPEVSHIFAVDDACPDKSGDLIKAHCNDPRLTVLRHEQNKGVGGAVLTGYRAALEAGCDVVVKVDGDGQMDPALILEIARPVLEGSADYAKGNRFHSVWNVRQMPGMRLFGNAALSFLTKLSSGYWSIFDPTNGYTAVHAAALKRLEFGNISERYFFESSMLINLGNVRAVVRDVPMEAVYADEESNLKITRVLGEFLRHNLRELAKRLLYTYFLRDFSLASAQLLAGTVMMVFGVLFGMWGWYQSIHTGSAATTGTVMLAVLPIILGFQLLLSFLGFDMANEPRVPIQPMAPLNNLVRDLIERTVSARAA